MARGRRRGLEDVEMVRGSGRDARSIYKGLGPDGSHESEDGRRGGQMKSGSLYGKAVRPEVSGGFVGMCRRSRTRTAWRGLGSRAASRW